MSASKFHPALRWIASGWRTILLVVMGLVGALVLVALIVTLGEANRQRDNALKLQSHSYDVMVLARTLAGTIARSEASLGRYVISGDRELGQLYYDEWRLAGHQIDRLDRLTNDNREQQQRIDRLRAAYDRRGTELSLTALSTNYGKNDQALSRYYRARKATSLGEINAMLDKIIERERTLLNRRTTDAMETVVQSSGVARILSIFGILLVIGAIALGWLTVRATSDRAVARADARSAQRRAEELAIAIGEATEALRQQEARFHQAQKMEAVGQLTGGIAHDFNNMLAVVLGGLELARRGLRKGGVDIARHLDSATEGANRAAALTRQLLAFAREGEINTETIAAGPLIAGMRDLLDRTLGDAVSVEVVDQSRGWMVRADRVRLENAILNLAVNARDAMEGRGHLRITAGAEIIEEGDRSFCPSGDYLTIGVTDSGCGMPADTLERAFEPFFTTKPVGKGTGLGLSQIFGFVRQIHGDVGIISAPGEGTCVTLYLPRDTAAAAALNPVSGANAAMEGAPGPLKILVVEDDPRVLAATVGALEDLGHHVIACDDPLGAPALLDEHDFQLIVSDVLMPRQTGPEMIMALEARHLAIPVLFVTGFAGEAGGAGEFSGRPVLRKPFTFAALEGAIETALGPSMRDDHRPAIAAE